jgi:hypothetical protein
VAIFSWWSADHASAVEGLQWLYISMAAFSFLFVLLSLAIILLKNVATAELLVFFAILASMPFTLHLSQLAIVVIASFFALTAVHRIRRDLELNVRIDIWKSLRMGKTFFICAFSLLIAGQYYVNVLENSANKGVPDLDIGHVGGKMTMQILSSFNPSFASLKKEDITVDDFIMESWQNQKSLLKEDGNNNLSDALIDQQMEKSDVPVEQRDALRNDTRNRLNQVRAAMVDDNETLALVEGRKQFAEMVGHDIKGDEKIADVFTGIINKKINDFFAPNPQLPERAKAYPFFVSIILFISVFSLSSIAWWFAVAITVGIFRLLVRTGAVIVNTISVKAEIIEQ